VEDRISPMPLRGPRPSRQQARVHKRPMRNERLPAAEMSWQGRIQRKKALIDVIAKHLQKVGVVLKLATDAILIFLGSSCVFSMAWSESRIA
jgi:hypothetical protein